MMDYRTKVRALVGANAVLILLLVLGLVFSPERRSDRASRRRLLEDAKPVASIRLGGAETVELRKEGETWVMVDSGGVLPVDTARVKAFVDAVAAVDRLQPVSGDRASWQSLGLEGDKARTVVMATASGTTLLDMIVGSYANTGGQVYVALSEGDQSWSAPAGFASYAMSDRASWLELEAWAAAPAAKDVQEVSVTGSITVGDGEVLETGYTLAREGTGWAVRGGTQATVDVAKVEAMLRAILALRGEDYAPASEKAGTAALAVELRLGDGSSLKLVVEARRDDQRYAATSSQRQRRLYLPSWSIREAVKKLSDLVAAPAPAPATP